MINTKDELSVLLARWMETIGDLEYRCARNVDPIHRLHEDKIVYCLSDNSCPLQVEMEGLGTLCKYGEIKTKHEMRYGA